jgi:hypothetical protein
MGRHAIHQTEAAGRERDAERVADEPATAGAERVQRIRRRGV